MRCTCTVDDALPRNHHVADHEIRVPVPKGFMLRKDESQPKGSITGVFDKKRRNQPTDNFRIVHPTT